MITTTLAVFAIMSTFILFEDWLDQFRTYWPELGMLWHAVMAAAILAALWAAAFVVALPIYWLTGAAA